MENTMSDPVSSIRRKSLFRYSLLAVLSYQLPVGVAYLARYFDLAKYSYSQLNYGYVAYVLSSVTALIMIALKKKISKGYVYFILHYQVILSLIISSYLVYVLSDQRHLALIGCILPLIFVFIQSSMAVSMAAILFTVIFYLSVTYAAVTRGGQPGSIVSEILYTLVYIPVCIFMAYISKIMQDQQQKIKTANRRLKTTHGELETTYTELEITYAELETTHNELAEHNRRMTDSIRYAEMIQRSLLPGIERIKTVNPQSMFIWMPKDIVGGDIFFTFADPSSSLVALMDCTGHGVPGAFLTMIVYSEIRKIVMDEGCRNPGEILSRLNRAVKTVLHTRGGQADDGLDAAVCVFDHGVGTVTFAGARIPLFHITNGTVFKTDGDRQSIGYRHSIDDFIFTNHTIEVGEGCSFYLKTDGYTDQLGGERNLRFGTSRFQKIIRDHHDKPFDEQRKIFLQSLLQYKGDRNQIDDITLMGFRL